MQFFKELVKGIEISLVGGKFKFHIDFTSTFDLLNLFSKVEEEAERKAEEEAKKKEEEERKREEEKEEDWEDDDEW